MVEPAEASTNEQLDTSEWRKREIGTAAKNAAKLGASLVVTWGIGLAARLYIPRFLGPDRFGMLNFAEAFSATAFVLVDLGIENYVRKEIAVRPQYADDFIGGIVLVRVILTLVTFAGMNLALQATNSSADARNLVFIYGAMQFFVIGGTTSAGLLQAVNRVDEVSVLNIAMKVMWAGCLAAAVIFNLGLWAFGLAYTLTEAIKAILLFRAAKRHLRFSLRIRPRATWMVIVASLPFFVTGVANRIYDKIGATLLSFLTTNREVGWLGAANGLVGLTMLLAPLVGWVVIPLFARSAAQSSDEFHSMIRRTLEMALTISIPASLFIALGADIWVAILFGNAYAPAAAATRILATTTVLMYVSMVAFLALAVLNLTWKMTFVALGGMLINLTCNCLLIPWASAHLEPGGGAAASATATLLTEIGVVVPLFLLLGQRGYDRRLVVTSAKNLLCAMLVTLLHLTMPKSLGPLRIAIDAVVYVAVALAIGGVDARQLARLFKMAVAMKKSRA